MLYYPAYPAEAPAVAPADIALDEPADMALAPPAAMDPEPLKYKSTIRTYPYQGGILI